MSDAVPPNEQEAYQEHRSALVQALAPVGYLEARLAERAALTLWRLRRLELWEADLLEKFHQRPSEPSLHGDYSLLLPDHKLQMIQRYEAHLERVFYRALHELEAMQKRRGGGEAPLARLELHGVQGSGE